MALPLALYHPGTLLGIQVLVASVVLLVLWLSSKTSVLRATGFSVLALIVTAIATTLVARVPPYPDSKQAKMPPPATILLGLLAIPLVFFAYAILTSFLLRKYTNSNENMDIVYKPIGAAGVAVCVSWFFSSAFYFWRVERAKGTAESAAAKAKPAAAAKPTTR